MEHTIKDFSGLHEHMRSGATDDQRKEMAKDAIKDYGTIAFWRDSYGFIKADGGGQTEDIFAHISNVAPGPEPRKDARVSYHLAPDRRDPAKLMAVDVTVFSG